MTYLELRQALELLGCDRLTAQKAAHIVDTQKYGITGVILEGAGGNRCLVEHSAVRWLDVDEMWGIMHPDSFEAARKTLAECILSANKEFLLEQIIPDERAEFEDAWAKLQNHKKFQGQLHG